MQFHGHVLLSSDDEDLINDRCPLNRPAAADVALDQGSVDCCPIGIIESGGGDRDGCDGLHRSATETW